MEGGGNSAETKSRLRQGMSKFLNSLGQSARQKRLDWKIVACGSRNNARDAFLHATQASPQSFNVLLVDSEAPVDRQASPRIHLKQSDGWELGLDIDDDSLHLMIQIMETWIVADPDAVAAYYQKHFLKSAPPQSPES
jgi:hypothetical protein